MSNKPRLPDGAVLLDKYQDLDHYIQAFAQGLLNLLFVIGGPGLGKSRRLRDALAGACCWLSGNLTAHRLYCEMYRHVNAQVVLDDVDRLYGDRRAVTLLKSLCETSPAKRISWNTDSPILQREGIPHSFATSSHVAIITNDWRTLDKNVGALEDRGHVLVFEPTAEEVHREVARWFTDCEIFAFIAEHLHLIKRPSMRAYCLAHEQKQAGLPWKKNLLGRWLTGRTLTVACLLLDKSFRSESERVRAFQTLTNAAGHSDYYYHKAKLLPAKGPPEVHVACNGRSASLANLLGTDLTGRLT